MAGPMTMRNQVYFRTCLFENKTPKPHFINSCCFGEDLISWLLARLPGLTVGDPIQEDYGWGFWVDDNYWVAVGVLDDSIGAENPQWLVSVNYDAGLNLRKRLFGKPDRSRQLEICAAINLVLQNELAVTDIRWCDQKETDCGDNPA
jgi:hypothetical protein